MTNLFPERRDLRRPLYRSIAEAVAKAIERGELRPGGRLPTHRNLAHELGVSVHTASAAYLELERRGLVDGQVGRGTFVRNTTKEAETPFIVERGTRDIIDLSISRPVSGQVHAERIKATLTSLSNDLDLSTMLACRPVTGLERHRATAVKWLAGLGVETTEGLVLITNGAAAGLFVALATATRPGDLVVTEAIGHHLVIACASILGLRLEGLPIDDQGILPDGFETACSSGNVKALFTVPSLANPTATLLPGDRRETIAAIARRHGVAIIENDVWGRLIAHRPLPLASFAPELSYYATSFTKCVMPGIRTGFLVVPSDMIARATTRQIATNWMATPLVSEIAVRWIEDGTAMELITWQRTELTKRNQLAEHVLKGFRFSGHPNSLHFWLELPSNWRVDDLVHHARSHNVAIAPSGPFMVGDTPKRLAIRVAVGSPATHAELQRGLEVLAGLISREPEPVPLAI